MGVGGHFTKKKTSRHYDRHRDSLRGVYERKPVGNRSWGWETKIVGKKITKGRVHKNLLRTLVSHPGHPSPLDMT